MRAKRRMIEIRVHRRDIREGVNSDCWNCPIAIAARRQAVDDVHVDTSRFSDGAGRSLGIIPLKARRWQRRFDAGFTVDPIRFTMRVPDDYFPRRSRESK